MRRGRDPLHRDCGGDVVDGPRRVRRRQHGLDRHGLDVGDVGDRRGRHRSAAATTDGPPEAVTLVAYDSFPTEGTAARTMRSPSSPTTPASRSNC